MVWIIVWHSSVARTFIPRIFLWGIEKKIEKKSANCHRVEKSYRQGDNKNWYRSHQGHHRKCEEKGSGLYPIKRSPIENSCN